MPDPIATLHGYELNYNRYYYAVRSPGDSHGVCLYVSLADKVSVKTGVCTNRDPHHVAAYADKLTTACKVANYFQAVIDDRENN